MQSRKMLVVGAIGALSLGGFVVNAPAAQAFHSCTFAGAMDYMDPVPYDKGGKDAGATCRMAPSPYDSVAWAKFSAYDEKFFVRDVKANGSAATGTIENLTTGEKYSYRDTTRTIGPREVDLNFDEGDHIRIEICDGPDRCSSLALGYA